MTVNGLPSVEGFKGPKGARPAPPPPPKPPSDEPHEGYIPRNVDVRMSRAQARILRDKLRALQDAGAKTADGRFVDNRAQAVRWIIENLEA